MGGQISTLLSKFGLQDKLKDVMKTVGLGLGAALAVKYGMSYMNKEARAAQIQHGLSTMPGCTETITNSFDEVFMPLTILQSATLYSVEPGVAQHGFYTLVTSLDDMLWDMWLVYNGSAPRPLLFEDHRDNVLASLSYFYHAADIRVRELDDQELRLAPGLSAIGVPILQQYRYAALDLYESVRHIYHDMSAAGLDAILDGMRGDESLLLGDTPGHTEQLLRDIAQYRVFGTGHMFPTVFCSPMQG